MTGSHRVEPVIEAFIMAGQLADFDGAALAEQRAAASQRHGRVETAARISE